MTAVEQPRRSLTAPQPESAPAIPPAPELLRLFGDHAAATDQIDKQIKWWVDGLVAFARPLTQAVADVEDRSREWSTPAARQLHLDVVRFRSRLMNAMRLEDPPAT
ncbi:MAG: hypothetical protein H0T43_12565 [Solirubrobacterales bacterium]|nr:hypothetical protein [Solirubrobacterales bacterium]MBA3583546.1 hypothetical protein [Gemmatimonadota bacterium]